MIKYLSIIIGSGRTLCKIFSDMTCITISFMYALKILETRRMLCYPEYQKTTTCSVFMIMNTCKYKKKPHTT